MNRKEENLTVKKDNIEEKLGLNGPILLLIKESILDILGANDEKYNTNGSLDFIKLPENIRKVIESINLDEIIGEVEKINDWKTNLYIGLGLFDQGKVKKAIDYFTSLLDKNTSKDIIWFIYYYLGLSYNRLGDHESEIKNFELCLKNNTSEEKIWEIYFRIGLSYYNLKKYEDSIKYFEISLQNNPPLEELWKIYGNLGYSCQKLGKYEESCNYFIKVLSDPNFPKEESHITVYSYALSQSTQMKFNNN